MLYQLFLFCCSAVWNTLLYAILPCLQAVKSGRCNFLIVYCVIFKPAILVSRFLISLGNTGVDKTVVDVRVRSFGFKKSRRYTVDGGLRFSNVICM